METPTNCSWTLLKYFRHGSAAINSLLNKDQGSDVVMPLRRPHMDLSLLTWTVPAISATTGSAKWLICSSINDLSRFVSFSTTGSWLTETEDNVWCLLCSPTHFLPLEEAVVPACPLTPNLCRQAGGLWTPGTCPTLPLYHCSCNGHTR